jgi:hypothetical protein
LKLVIKLQVKGIYIIAKEELTSNITINIYLKEAITNIKVKDYAITILYLKSFKRQGILSSYYNRQF